MTSCMHANDPEKGLCILELQCNEPLTYCLRMYFSFLYLVFLCAPYKYSSLYIYVKQELQYGSTALVEYFGAKITFHIWSDSVHLWFCFQSNILLSCSLITT